MVNIFILGKSKGLPDERINPIAASNYSTTSSLNYVKAKIKVKFNESCLKQDKITYNHGKIGNIYIVYEKNRNFNITSYLTLENCLFGAVSSTKNNNIDKYEYSGYGIGFDRNYKFFGVDISSFVHVDKKKKYILVLGVGPTQGLADTILTAEEKYSINFAENNKKFCLRLHYNGAKSYLFVNGTEIIKFKARL